jgi:tryptophanyl-tRNA synthetase
MSSTTPLRIPLTSPPGGGLLACRGCASSRLGRLRSVRCRCASSRLGRLRSVRSYTARLVRIFSGIQPTGRKHLGNYIGAIRQYVEGQERGDPAIYCIVDLHATSVAYDPKALPVYVLDTAAMLMAAGLDPTRCILFRQSDVKEHTELCWLLCSVTPYGDLTRMHQFKEKSAREQELVRTSLFLYPVLQAADILAYKTDEVPVGDDQRQHLELSREIARRFNSTYGEVLVEPQHRIPEIGARVMDLQDPSTKMSTTYGSAAGLVYVDDEPEAIMQKFKRAQTDSGTEIVRRPDKPGISNLIEILAVIRGVQPEEIEREFEGQGYGAFKQAVGEATADFLAPIRERYGDLRADEAALEATLQEGAERARAIASGTLAEVRKVMGVGPSV